MMSYIHTYNTTPDELQRYLDDVMEAGCSYAEQYRPDITIDRSSGKPEEVCKRNGVDDIDGQRTTCFDTTTKKHGENGFYCLNAIEVYKLHPDFTRMNIPDHKDYTGLVETDDKSAWLPVDEEIS